MIRHEQSRFQRDRRRRTVGAATIASPRRSRTSSASSSSRAAPRGVGRTARGCRRRRELLQLPKMTALVPRECRTAALQRAATKPSFRSHVQTLDALLCESSAIKADKRTCAHTTADSRRSDRPSPRFLRRTSILTPPALRSIARRRSLGGSRFAQRIAQELTARGFTYVQTGRDRDFSARYGNIYTTRQFAQLIEQATGAFGHRRTTFGRIRGR